MQLIRRKMVKSAKESIKQKASNSEIYGKMQAVFIEIDSSPEVSSPISSCFSKKVIIWLETLLMTFSPQFVVLLQPKLQVHIL